MPFDSVRIRLDQHRNIINLIDHMDTIEFSYLVGRQAVAARPTLEDEFGHRAKP